MIKRQKIQLAISIAAFLLSLLGLFVVIFINTSKENSREQKEAVLTVDTSMAVRLEVNGGKYDYILERPDKDSDIWILKADGSRINNEKITAMLSSIERVITSRIISGSSNLSDYGLTEPQMTIGIELIDGERHFIEIGNYSGAEHMFYARIDEKEDVYLITTLINSVFDLSKDELIEK